MMILVALVLLAVLYNCAASANTGRVAVWSDASSFVTSSAPVYKTQTMDVSSVLAFLQSTDFEPLKIVLLTTQQKTETESSYSTFSTDFFRNAFRSSAYKTVMSSVVHESESEAAAATLSQALLASDAFKSSEILNVAEFLAVLNTDSKTKAFVVTIDEETSFETLKAAGAKSNVLFVAIEDNRHTEQRGNYNRVLGSTASASASTSASASDTASASNSDIFGSKYYEPEGTEFSIYSAGTYLYITPDIFTGLMTFLFMFCVLMTGLSCLGSIKGSNHFYDKTPTVGREA